MLHMLKDIEENKHKHNEKRNGKQNKQISQRESQDLKNTLSEYVTMGFTTKQQRHNRDGQVINRTQSHFHVTPRYYDFSHGASHFIVPYKKPQITTKVEISFMQRDRD